MTDEEQIPTGLLKPASTLFGGPLRASSVDKLSLDHTFIFDDEQSSALAELQTNVLRLQVFSNQPALQVYVARSDREKTSVCLEPHGYVNAPNQTGFPGILLAPDEVYCNRICYAFSETRRG